MDFVIVLVCSILGCGGICFLVVVFADYRFAAELFMASGIAKLLLPCTSALAARLIHIRGMTDLEWLRRNAMAGNAG